MDRDEMRQISKSILKFFDSNLCEVCCEISEDNLEECATCKRFFCQEFCLLDSELFQNKNSVRLCRLR